MSISVIPYDPAYEAEIRKLENTANQGGHIVLKIIKNNFLDRSSVFEKNFPVLSIDENKILAGTCVGVHTNIIINGEHFETGFALDAKVSPAYRNQGVGGMMAKHVYKNFFQQQQFKKNFTTLKLTNIPVIKLSAKAVGKTWLYDFVYLTIPATSRISERFIPKDASKLSVRLFRPERLCSDYYLNFTTGLGCFYTHKMYRLKIVQISRLYKLGLSALKLTNPRKYSLLPKEKEVINFATLYNHSEKNIKNINNVLDHLAEKKIKYLLVCCRKNDDIYKYLKKHSINTYRYYVLADFHLSARDHLTVDVRCL